jgi:hypothetical protein
MTAPHAVILFVLKQPGYKTHKIPVEVRQAGPGCVAGGMSVSETPTTPLPSLLTKTNIKLLIFYL